MLRSIIGGSVPTRIGIYATEVPLDAVKTKLEDCQRDIGKNLRTFLRDSLELP